MKKPALLLAAAAAFAWSAPGEAAASPPRLEMAAACTVAGAPEGARCGVLHVPENRSAPGGRAVPLHFAIVPGADPAAADPIVFIAGGPGQSALQVMPLALADLRAIDPRRDIVFLDQRGTGLSNPLGCEGGFDLIDAGAASPAFRRCLDTLRARADLDRYGTADAVADLEDLRRALGRERVNLVAGSYGTRVALFYMRAHPERIRSAILRAAAPLDFNIVADGTAAADAELARVLDECRADAACDAAYPELAARLRALSDRLEAAPETVTLPAPGGGTRSFPVSATFFHQTLYALMLSAESRQQLPMVIATAARAGLQPLAPLLGQVRDQLLGGLTVGMYMGVVCAEDAPRLPAGAAPEGRTPLVRMGAKLAAACRSWPVAAAPAGHLDQPILETPTLILSGTLDPATTAAAADRLAARLPRSAHVVVPATAHGPLFPDCVRADTARFLDRASADGIRPDCSGVALAPFAMPAAARGN